MLLHNTSHDGLGQTAVEQRCLFSCEKLNDSFL